MTRPVRCTCVRCNPWPPPVEQTDPALRRALWIAYLVALVLVAGLVAYGCSS